VALIGGNTEQKSIEDVAYLNYLCDQFGLDTISTGSVVAFALECLEKGLLKASDFDGRDLKFGNPDDFEYIVRKIVNRDGIGDLLAQGTRAAAEKIGPEAMRIAIQVKGLEWSGYEARYAAATMLSYITSDTGAHHSRSWAITYDVAKGRDSLEGKAERTIELQHIRPMFDLLCCCRLQWVEIGFELEWYPKMFAAVTGNAATYDDLMFVSERVWNLTRAFWQREVGDFGRKYDYPPARFMEEPVPDGPAAGHLTSRETVDALLDRYYDLRGWDRNGLPLKSKLESLGLGDVARALAN
jgi:aldehyde:ferredoxin oxidoreductase